MTEIEKTCFVIGIIAVTIGIMFICYRLREYDRLFYEWRDHMLKHDKCFTDIEWHRVDDLSKLAALEQRVRVLEEKLDDHLEHSAIPEYPNPLEFPDPEDKRIWHFYI